MDWDSGDLGSSPHLAIGNPLGDFGPVTNSQPNLPHRAVVVRIKWRRRMYATLGSLEEKRQDIKAIINKINKNKRRPPALY